MVRRLAPIVLTVLAVSPLIARAATPGGVVRPSAEGTIPERELGRQLFAANCASCHGSTGQGIPVPTAQRGVPTLSGQGPSLHGVGALAADFYLRNGYMPLSHPHDQPKESKVLFSQRELRGLIDYVASLGPGPAVPRPGPGSVPDGKQLFTEHCAGCHQEVAEGGVVTGARVPPLKGLSATRIAEAVRVGPYVMPRFDRTALSDHELDNIVAYVRSVGTPTDRGGWGIGHLGPVPEGMVVWFIAGGAILGLCLLIGKRMRQ